MNHVMHKPLFGKQESQESIQESRNQAKILKIPESCQQKFQSCGPLSMIKWRWLSTMHIFSQNN